MLSEIQHKVSSVTLGKISIGGGDLSFLPIFFLISIETSNLFDHKKSVNTNKYGHCMML